MIGLKKEVLHNREKRQIPIDHIILPSFGDLRSFRDEAFERRLYRDLAKEGLIALPIVRPCVDRPDYYECLDGWSRVEQLRLLEYESVECIVVVVDDASAICMSLKMNIVRKGHDAIGIASTFKMLHDLHGMRYAEIAKRFGYHRAWVYKLVKLLELPKRIQEKVAHGDISVKDALAMLAGRYSSEVLVKDKKQMCDFCFGSFDPHEIDRAIMCYRCKSRLNRLLDEGEKELKAELETAAKLSKERQKTLVNE